MRAGEKGIIATMVVLVAGMMIYRAVNVPKLDSEKDLEIPFYTTASPELKHDAEVLYNEQGCDQCHSLWMNRNMMQSVPAPAMDGIGSLRTEKWFYDYLSAKDPQSILPSRLKPEYRMPSYAQLPEKDRRMLASYLASLKVKDWYLDDTKKAEYEKLTGKRYHSAANHEPSDQK